MRRGEFEGLRDEIGTTPQRTPDFGPSAVHSTAGAVAIGARPFLVAYNVYLGPASNLAVAKDVAKAVRGSSGGLRYVKATRLRGRRTGAGLDESRRHREDAAAPRVRHGEAWRPRRAA